MKVVDKSLALFSQAMEVLNRRGEADYWDSLRKLPESVQNKLNYVIQYGAIYILESFDIR